MKLKTYITKSPRGTAKKLADDLGVSPSMLSQMASGDAPISPEKAVRIEELTNGKVTRKDTHPKKWAAIWPELIKAA